MFFCCAVLEQTYVMGGGQGFTDYVHKFVEAEEKDAASDAYRDYLEKKGIRVRRVRASMAVKQDKTRYVFPEAILDAMQGHDWYAPCERRRRI